MASTMAQAEACLMVLLLFALMPLLYAANGVGCPRGKCCPVGLNCAVNRNLCKRSSSIHCREGNLYNVRTYRACRHVRESDRVYKYTLLRVATH